MRRAFFLALFLSQPLAAQDSAHWLENAFLDLQARIVSGSKTLQKTRIAPETAAGTTVPVLIIELDYSSEPGNPLSTSELHRLQVDLPERFPEKPFKRFLYPQTGGAYLREEISRLQALPQRDAQTEQRLQDLEFHHSYWYKLGDHGTRMVDKFRKTPCHWSHPKISHTALALPIAMRLPLKHLDDSYRNAFQELLEHAVEAGVRIISISIGFDREDWPYLESFVDRHPEVAFVVSAGSEGIAVENHDRYPQKLATKPNVIVVGLVRDKVGGGRGTPVNPNPIVHNYSSQGLIDAYCDFEGLCGSTSEAAVEYSKLLALLQSRERMKKPGQGISGQELHRLLLDKLKILPHARHWSAQKNDPPYPVKVYNCATYHDVISSP